MERDEIGEQRADIRTAFASAKLLVSFVCRMNREPVKSPMRSVANTEFHGTGHRINEVGHLIARRLEDMGIRAMNEPMAFPMEMDRIGKRQVAVVYLAQTHRAGGGAGHDGLASQRDPSALWQFHFAGHRGGGRSDRSREFSD
jgi:hypothetical protein